MTPFPDQAPTAAYLHIPFCRQKCTYCDFISFAARGRDCQQAYVAALLREIGIVASNRFYLPGRQPVPLQTVFVGGGTPTVLPAGDLVRFSGEFRPDKQPEVRKVEFFDVPLREHYGEVTWSAPIELPDGVDPERLKFEVQFDGQICSDEVGCKPIFGKKIEIAFGGFLGQTQQPEASAKATITDSEPVADVFRADRAHVALNGHLEPAAAAPGGKVRLAITATLDPGWHVYAYAPRDPQLVAKPTLIVVTEPAAWARGPVVASQDPIVKQPDGEQPAVSYHEKSVTWTVEIAVPAEAAAGEYTVTGIVGYQTCTETGCDRPLAAKFTASVSVGAAASGERRPLAFTDERYSEAAQLAAASLPEASEAPSAAAPKIGRASCRERVYHPV